MQETQVVGVKRKFIGWDDDYQEEEEDYSSEEIDDEYDFPRAVKKKASKKKREPPKKKRKIASVKKGEELYTFKSAAEKILRENKVPMKAKEITDIALERGYISTEGATPHRSIAAQMYVDMQKRGNQSVFAKGDKKGYFALREWGGYGEDDGPPGEMKKKKKKKKAKKVKKKKKKKKEKAKKAKPFLVYSSKKYQDHNKMVAKVAYRKNGQDEYDPVYAESYSDFWRTTQQRLHKDDGSIEQTCKFCKTAIPEETTRGQLMFCNFSGCTKVYHENCLKQACGETEIPEAYVCPDHFCGTCKEPAKYSCVTCPFAFCAKHVNTKVMFPIKFDKNRICEHCKPYFDSECV